MSIHLYPQYTKKKEKPPYDIQQQQQHDKMKQINILTLFEMDEKTNDLSFEEYIQFINGVKSLSTIKEDRMYYETWYNNNDYWDEHAHTDYDADATDPNITRTNCYSDDRFNNMTDKEFKGFCNPNRYIYAYQYDYLRYVTKRY